MKAIVLTFDRLPAHLLGCYGNEWTETPGFDRLASLGSVLDQHFAEVPGPVSANHSWWTGRFEFFHDPVTEKQCDGGSDRNWLQRLGDQGVKCRLLAENTEGLPTQLFHSSEAVGGVTGLNAPHDDVPIARLIQRGLEILEGDGSEATGADENSPAELLWLHSQGVPSPWLPPRLFAELYLDELEEIVDGESGGDIASDLVGQFENDPDLVRLLLSDWRSEAEVEGESDSEEVAGDDVSATPDEVSDDIDSPELERQISRLVFAGYVSMIDRWVLKLLEAVESSDEKILFVVTANQGHSFGETVDLVPSAVGSGPTYPDSGRASNPYLPGSLTDTEVRTPLVIAEFSRTANGHTFGSRHSALVQPVDVAATLENCLGNVSSIASGIQSEANSRHPRTGGDPANRQELDARLRGHDVVANQDGISDMVRNVDGDSATESRIVGQDLQAAISGGTPEGRSEALYLGADGQLGVRTRNWALVTSAEALQDEELVDSDVRLFAKPDDQWDVHDVSSQYREEVDTLLRLLRVRHSRGK